MKKIASVFLGLLFAISLLFVSTSEAKAENITVKGIPSEAKIGDTFSFTVSIPANIGGFVYVEYDKDVLEYVSGPQESSNGLIKYTAFFESSPQTIKLKVKSAGKTSIKIYMDEAEYSDTVDKLPSIPAVTKSITVANETENTELSSDYFLSKLNVMSGSKKVELSPTFNYRKTNYTATVKNDVTDVVVSVSRSNNKAEIVSITDNGKVKLEVGENRIEILVKAENGKTLLYVVTITREKAPEENPTDPPVTPDPPTPATPDFEYGGNSLYCVETPEGKIPANFVEKTVILSGGKEVLGLSFEKADLTILYLENENKAGGFYVYHAEENHIYPFVKLSSEENYVIFLAPQDEDDVPEGYTSCTFSIEGKGMVNGYQYLPEGVENSDFYLVSGLNNSGKKGWYVYDMKEGTYQRYNGMVPSGNGQNEPEDPTPSEPDTDEPNTGGTGDEEDKDTVVLQPGDILITAGDVENITRIGLCAAIFLGAVLIIIIINILLKKHRSVEDYDDDDEDNGDEYDEFDDRKVFKPIKPRDWDAVPKEDEAVSEHDTSKTEKPSAKTTAKAQEEPKEEVPQSAEENGTAYAPLQETEAKEAAVQEIDGMMIPEVTLDENEEAERTPKKQDETDGVEFIDI